MLLAKGSTISHGDDEIATTEVTSMFYRGSLNIKVTATSIPNHEQNATLATPVAL